ncbi:NAD synthetase [Geomicrobium sp. JCM 19037]|uniref:ammonia-dependent NAD(+) synthetase n=1 Tax=Geomicrobium sp. JCM 19037 TaxID=1460634 RepID=UPI00045F1D75|nr:ammonia-dependent NAD(+) synthetase [Geomicrobium sp. JCM 19037]GAK01959.1 NAD synthetase [Geomicrobium sp. JCM 19037]
MAFGVSKREMEQWKARARAGEISILTHFWLDDRFPDCDTVTKVACADLEKLLQWGKRYGLSKEWIHERGSLSHFDLFGTYQQKVLIQEGKLDQYERFIKPLGGMKMNREEIIEALEVNPFIEPEHAFKKRKEFMKAYIKNTGTNGFVLGISGGQDSTLLGKMAQSAVAELRNEENDDRYQFLALRLPYGEQKDEDDAKRALEFIEPDHVLTVNIKPAVDAAVKAYEDAAGEKLSDFVKGNTKARERMKVHYDFAASKGLLVIGTDHAAEAVTGFFTKFGDGACDLTPLFGLTKRQGKEILKYLDAPEETYLKVPTADLEDDRPGLSDEEALGLTYEQIDDFLEGKPLDKEVEDKIITGYNKTEHKRVGPVTPQDDWWKR